MVWEGILWSGLLDIGLQTNKRETAKACIFQFQGKRSVSSWHRGTTSEWDTTEPCIERDLGITCGNRASLPYDPLSPKRYGGKVCEERVNIFLHLYGRTVTLKMSGYLLYPGVRNHKQEGGHSPARKTSTELQSFLLMRVKVLSITGWWLRLGSVLMDLAEASP